MKLKEIVQQIIKELSDSAEYYQKHPEARKKKQEYMN